MNDRFHYDLAVCAANLAERTEIVGHVGMQVREGPDAPRGSLNTGLSAFDAWRIDKLAGMLGTPFVDDSFLESAAPPDRKGEYVQLLTAYRRWELGLAGSGGPDDDDDPDGPRGLDQATRALLDAIHASWLPTYLQALESFGAGGRDEDPGASWRSPATYHERFAVVAEPFLLLLGREVEAACHEANGAGGAGGSPQFAQSFVEGWYAHFLERFELMLAWALEADKNVYCAVHGIAKESTTHEDYLAYVGHTFASAVTYHAFYLRFPMLGRWLAHVTRLVCDNARLLIQRLAADAQEISSTLFGGRPLSFTSVELGKSDPHAGGQTVGRVSVEQQGGPPGAFMYKPRSMKPDRAVQRLLAVLGDAGAVSFPARAMLLGDGYGYEEVVPAGRNHVGSRQEAERVFEQLGGYLGVFHVLGGGDLHFENLLVADGQAHVCDCETVLGVRPLGQVLPLETMLDSVYSTGLLEWPRDLGGRGDREAVRISGSGGGEPYALPFPSPRINDRRGSMAMGVRHETGLRIEAGGTNRVWLDGRLLEPAEFRSSIVAGFEAVHRWFEENEAVAVCMVEDLFEAVPVRFVNWATQVYSHLLVSLRHPKCLVDPLEVDVAIGKLYRHRRKWDRDGLLAEREAQSLWKLDVPLFAARASGRALVHDHAVTVSLPLESTPLEEAVRRVRRLSGLNRRKQVQYIAASLRVEGDDTPEFVASCVDYAVRAGRKLCSLMQDGSRPAPWRSYQLTAGGPAYVDVTADLYGGTAGIALFLGYLDAIAPDKEFRMGAERAIAHALANRPAGIGAFNGLAGLVYVASHLSELWGDVRLLDQAVELAGQVCGRLAQDRHHDVLSGTAGIIPVMLGLYQVAPGEGLDCAHRCARRLLAYAERSPAGLSWPLADPADGIANFTGFAHGAGGIGWALIALGAATGREDYVEVGRQAFAYENHHFDDEEKDWYDLRTSSIELSKGRRHFPDVWCNGAAGIGLSRIASWAALGKSDERMLRDAQLALGATLRSFHTVRNDSLCHGRCGNAELFLRFARLKGEPAYELEAGVQAQAQWQSFEKDQTLSVGVGAERQFPGLMLGLAGYGLHFLRLGHPDRVPSPLLLDPVLAGWSPTRTTLMATASGVG
jgi:type 2 lantibiotic biosynthesis protein LanM